LPEDANPDASLEAFYATLVNLVFLVIYGNSEQALMM